MTSRVLEIIKKTNEQKKIYENLENNTEHSVKTVSDFLGDNYEPGDDVPGLHKKYQSHVNGQIPFEKFHSLLRKVADSSKKIRVVGYQIKAKK